MIFERLNFNLFKYYLLQVNLNFKFKFTITSVRYSEHIFVLKVLPN